MILLAEQQRRGNSTHSDVLDGLDGMFSCPRIFLYTDLFGSQSTIARAVDFDWAYPLPSSKTNTSALTSNRLR